MIRDPILRSNDPRESAAFSAHPLESIGCGLALPSFLLFVFGLAFPSGNASLAERAIRLPETGGAALGVSSGFPMQSLAVFLFACALIALGAALRRRRERS